jgi:hypothetical protein
LKVWENVLVYVVGLLAIPPFPLLCLLLRLRSCDRWALVAVPILLLFVFYGFRDESPRVLENLLGGQRYLLVAHAALLIATAGVWSRIPLVRRPPAVLTVGVLAVAIHHVSMKHLADRFEPAARAIAACQPTRIAYNQYASRVALSTDSVAYEMFGESPPTVPPDLAVISLRQLSNRFSAPVTYQIPEWLSPYSARCRSVGEFRIFDLANRCPPAGEPCPASDAR